MWSKVFLKTIESKMCKKKWKTSCHIGYKSRSKGGNSATEKNKHALNSYWTVSHTEYQNTNQGHKTWILSLILTCFFKQVTQPLWPLFPSVKWRIQLVLFLFVKISLTEIVYDIKPHVIKSELITGHFIIHKTIGFIPLSQILQIIIVKNNKKIRKKNNISQCCTVHLNVYIFIYIYHLILLTTLKIRYFYLHFTDEKTEVH